MSVRSHRAVHATPLFPKKLLLTSSTSSCLSVSVVDLLIKIHGVNSFVCCYIEKIYQVSEGLFSFIEK
jgi:hypothetical protein